MAAQTFTDELTAPPEPTRADVEREQAVRQHVVASSAANMLGNRRSGGDQEEPAVRVERHADTGRHPRREVPGGRPGGRVDRKDGCASGVSVEADDDEILENHRRRTCGDVRAVGKCAEIQPAAVPER